MKRILIVLLLLGICVPCYGLAPFEGGDKIGRIRDIDSIFNDIWEDEYNAIRVRVSSDIGAVSVDVSVPKSFITGQLTIDAASTGTPVVLTADTAAVVGIEVIPLFSNVGQVYIRNSSTRPASTEGYMLTADSATPLRVDSTSDVYMDADVAGDGISWIGFIK